MNRTEAGVERVSQAEDVHMPMRSDQGLRKVFPSLEYGYLWSRAPEASDAPYDEVAGEDPPDGVRTSSPVLCRRCSVDRWLFGHLCQAEGDNERNRAVLAKELQAGGYHRVIVRSDGEPALLAHVKAARAMTLVSDVPLESVYEQVSKEQSPGNGLAEGAVKELKAKIRTLRHSTEMGLGRRIPETHDSLAWLVTHAAATINWFRPGLGGKTSYELRVGRKFRRPVAPREQKVWWMSAGKHVSRISAESRWLEGIFLGILGRGVGASDYAIGTPEGCNRPEQSRWCLKLMHGTSNCWDRRRADPAARIRLSAPEVQPEHVLPPPVGEPAGPRSRRVYRHDVEIRKYGVTIGCPGCKAITAGTAAQGHSDECRARIEQKTLEDVTGEGVMRFEEVSGENVQGLMMRAAEQTWRWRWQQGIPFVLFNMVVPVRRGR